MREEIMHILNQYTKKKAGSLPHVQTEQEISHFPQPNVKILYHQGVQHRRS